MKGQDLITKYPKLFKEALLPSVQSCMGRGIECWEGWYPLLDSLCGHLQLVSDRSGYQIVIRQVKSKFARLTIYWGFEVAGADVPELHRAVADKLVEAHADLSEEICEVCGKPGKSVTGDTGWIYAECPECTAQRELLGPCWHLDKQKDTQ